MKLIFSTTLFKTLLTLLCVVNLILLLVINLTSCASNKSDPTKQPSAKQPVTHKENKVKRPEKKERQYLSSNQPLVTPSNTNASPSNESTKMQITYSNRSSQMNITFDLNNQDVFLQMTGSPYRKDNIDTYSPTPSQNKPSNNPTHSQSPSPQAPNSPPPSGEGWNLPLQDSTSGELKTSNSTHLHMVLAELRKAQELFYQKKYKEAMDMTLQSLNKEETAEGHALMGTILYVLGNKNGAEKSWKQSLKLNPDMPNVTNMLNKIGKE